jgi:hypothetical protein
MYPTIKLLSHSSISSLQSCPRKYELSKLSKLEKTSSIHTTYGTVVGLGLAEYFLSKDLDKAKLLMFIAWDLHLFEHEPKSNKCLQTAWLAIDKLAANIDISREYANCVVPTFNDKPAVELSFCIDLGKGYYYRGFVDVVLYDTVLNKYIVLECKTTGAYTIDEASYANSDQAISYGVVLDLIATNNKTINNYNVDYLVYGTKNKEWELLPFTKTKFARAKWLLDLITRTEILDLYGALPYFPTNGNSCVTFTKRCEFYGVCTLPTNRLVDMSRLVDDEFNWVKELDTWQFHFNYLDLLNNEETLNG